MNRRALYLAGWHALWSLGVRYHRYECEGFERLAEHYAQRRPALLVSYHARGYPLDLYMLTDKMQNELGRMPRYIGVLKAVESTPIFGDMMRTLGFFFEEPDEATMRALCDAGELLAVCPGGMREALRPAWRDRYRVDFGQRRGYVRMALRYGLPILPAAAVGVDETYLGLYDGHRLSRYLFGHGRSPLWLGVGMGGFWPFSLSWPVKIRQKIGAPISLDDLRALHADEPALLEAAHERVSTAIQSLLDELLQSSGRGGEARRV